MKTSVRTVKVRDQDGNSKFVSIRTEKGELKYVFILKLIEAGVLVPDRDTNRILYDVIKAYMTLKHDKAEIVKMYNDLGESIMHYPEEYVDSYEIQESRNGSFDDVLRDLHLEQSERIV